jgi:hypothetical protein
MNITQEGRMISKEDKKKLEQAAKRAFDLEKGKTVLVQFSDDYFIRVDYRCLDKDTDVCVDCKLRFRCYLSQYLTLDPKELNLNLDATINESVKMFVERHKPHNGGKSKKS